MVICIVALIVFSILGIFSIRWRKLAKEAFTCVGRMLTFRPCKTKLDQRIRSKVTSKLMRRTPSLARLFYRHFKIISWIFTIAFFASMIYSFYGIYNLAAYGTCQPGATCSINKLAQLITCYETQIIYGILIIVFVVSLILMIKSRLKIEHK